MRKSIRSATPEDIGFLYTGLIADFADQGLAHMFKHTKESLHDALFGEDPAAKVAIAMSDEMPAGFAIYAIDRRGFAALYTPTLFLHDLYVAPSMRRLGFASFLIDHLKTGSSAKFVGARRLGQFAELVI